MLTQFNQTTLFINSPLEPSHLINFQQDLITILGYNLIVNITMIYLLLMLTWAFTVRFVLDTDSFLTKVKSWSLGKYLYPVLNKLINIWKKSTVLWIYFILFFLLFFSIASSYAIYACLFVLS